MNRPNSAILAGFLFSVLIVLGGATLAKGGFYLGKHEGDTLHLMQILIRMSAGEWPHLDFMTPIGVLAFTPIVFFLKLGFGAGHAIVLGQILVAVVFLPAIWWVARSRFNGGWAYLFGAGVLVLILALVHGEAERSVSISMHYNRWAWAAGFLAIATALLPGEGRHGSTADGMVIGLAMAALVLCKVTYAVAFAPAIVVALLGRLAWRTLFWAVLSALGVAGLVTLLAGPAFWLAYVNDLLTVAGSDVRPRPGLELSSVIGAPAYMGGSIVLVFSIIFLRQAGRRLEGLVLLLLMPGFFYVTYQNYGNDPQWMGLLALVLFALRPLREVRNGLGWDVQKGTGFLAAMALAFATPSYLNLLYSPFRHLGAEAEDYMPLIPGSGRHEDIKAAKIRALTANLTTRLDFANDAFAGFTIPVEEGEEGETRETVFLGETLPDCQLEMGMVAWFASVSADLQSSGLSQDKAVFAADLLSVYWLYGAFRPLEHAAPWYYGGLPGFDGADYLIVPVCPLSQKVRKQVLAAVEASGAVMTEVRRTKEYILFAKGEAPSDAPERTDDEIDQ